METIAEAVSHRLWDARLTVGVATRTIRDCIRVGNEDLPTLTSYLDSRFVIGDAGLFADLDQEVRTRITKNAQDFIEGKLAEQRERHERFGESLFLLQPHLREGVGALRDYHTALWVARAVRWDVRRPEHLHLHGFIDADELDDLLCALDFMWRVRNELHRGERKEDRLHFAAQEQLAERLGFEAAGGLFPAERLMQAYYLHARAIERVGQRTADHARALAERRIGRQLPGPYPVEEGFAIADGRLEIPGAPVLLERPVRLLAAFIIAQERDVEISARAQRLLRQHLYLIDDAFREDPEAAALFSRLLSSSDRVYRSLKLMAEVGILGAYIPEFGRVVGLWQQDLYHTYTVDVHSLFLVEQLRRLQKERFREELPLATELMRETRFPVVLFLGCILHDIGKGRNGGHSEIGADLAGAVCKRLRLSDEESQAVQFLVRNHLVMSEMAEQRDVHDPRQILKLANLAPTRDDLRRLYLLTVADIRSVSAEAWNSWKGGLLEALYRNAAEWLEVGAEDEEASRIFLERATQGLNAAQREVAQRVASAGLDDARSTAFLDSMPRRYFLSHSPFEIAEHVEAALSFLDSGAPIGVHPFGPPSDGPSFWGLMILARDEPGLFSIVTGVLTACGHDILAAQAYTTRDSLAVEIYQVKPISGEAPEEERARERIEASLRDVLEGRRGMTALMAGRASRVPRSARTLPPSVAISNDESDFYTVIDVTTNDRPALLYDITRTLTEQRLNVVASRASTRANRAVDAFYVTDGGYKITDPERQKEIEVAIFEAIRRGSG